MRHSGYPPVEIIAPRIAYSMAMWWLLKFPAILASLFVVPVKLLMGWDGKTGPFGNSKYGKYGNDAAPTQGHFFKAWHFLCIKNPVSNFGHEVLANWVNTDKPTEIWGFTGITDGPAKIRGWYFILHPEEAWEFRLVWPTFPGRCIKASIGWELNGNVGKDDYYQRCTFVCRLNPWRKFG